MKTALRLALVLTAILALPSAAFAQWDTPSRAFHKATAFPLDGRHLNVPCASCHLNGQTKGTPTTCVECHWNRRQDDPYRTRLGTTCEQCHRTTSWTAVTWNHATATGVPLVGGHQTLTCDSCHKGGVFTGTSVACASCHQRDFDSAKQPDHLAAGFPLDCEVCHRATDTTFEQGRFDHNSSFPLVGVHALQTCVACHANNVFQGTPRDCYTCHRTDYDRTNAPNHASSGFGTSCDSCHKATDPSWTTASFNHNQFFVLSGVHATTDCASCHVNNLFKGTPTSCIGCHQSDFDKTTTPNHAAAGFSTSCDSCHKASDPTWNTVGFNHTPFFKLCGEHALLQCTQCHINNVYKGTPRECYPCHQAEFQQAQNPNHVAAGFPTACEPCHKASDISFSLGTIVHPDFPITGVHNHGCIQCHQNMADLSQFTCTTACHTRPDMDSAHAGKSGYVYESGACLACHPTGKAI